MKAKRIVSILLTGSMLLSLLPVSALAAAPVFENRGLISSGTYSLPVHNSGIISGGTFQAGVNNSGNISGGQFNGSVANNSGTISGGTFLDDVSNSDTISGGTFQADVDNNGTISDGTFQRVVFNHGTISDGIFLGDMNNWGTISGGIFQGGYNYKTISGGTFQENVYNHGTISNGNFQGNVNNDGTISGGTFQKAVHNDATPDNQGFILDGIFKEQVHNWGTISGGIFQGEVHNWGTISGGTFEEVVEMNESPEGAKIEGGTFKKGIELNAYFPTITIKGGLFDGEVSAAEGYSGMLSINGGYFVNKPSLPVGSDTRFTTVSDQDGRTFQVPVNGDWSESGYNKLYVPSGSSEQPNTITVKTAAPLTDCLAGDVSIMGTDKVQLNNDGSYTIEVYQPTSIVLVTAEPAPGEPGGELDPEFSSGAAALGIVLGTAGLGYVTYVCGSSLYLHYVLPDGFIPSTQQELATVLWTTAGKPDPVSTALYTDISADSIELQKAARWCAEQGLLSDHGTTFGADARVTNARIIRAWNSLKKVPVTIQ